MVINSIRPFHSNMTIKTIFATLILCALSLSVQARQEIRFYEANTHLQTDRVSLHKKKGKTPGCHNFLIRTRVYQANQLGFESCSLYEEKNCAGESVKEVNRTKDETPVTELSQGYSWFPIDDNERGAILRSWKCEPFAEESTAESND